MITAPTETFVSLPYENVYCRRCHERVGEFIGKARCWNCGAETYSVLTKELKRD